MKWGDTHARERGNLTAVIWKDNWDVYMWRLYTDHQWKETHNEHGKARKPVIVEDYSWCMGYVNKGNNG